MELAKYSVGESSYLITSDTLVGGACTVITREAWGKCNYKIFKNVFLNKTHDSVMDLLKSLSYEIGIIVAGIPLTNSDLLWIRDNVEQEKILVVNHYDCGFSQEERSYSWLVEDFVDRTSVSILKEEFENREMIGRDNGRLNYYCNLVNSYEFDKSRGQPSNLNRLFDMMVFEDFVNRGYDSFTVYELFALENFLKKEYNYLKQLTFSTLIDDNGRKCNKVFVGTDDYIREVGEMGMNQGCDYCIVVNLISNVVHLFSDGCIDVGSIARDAGGNGTRKYAETYCNGPLPWKWSECRR